MRVPHIGKKVFLLATALAVVGGSPLIMASTASAQAGVISGQVTGADTGSGISGICVTALAPGQGFLEPGTASTTTGPLGVYSFSDLDVGTAYKVFFWDCNQSARYAGQYWPDQPFGPGQSVTAPQTGVNAVLSVGATIEGTVTQESEFYDTPISNVCVENLPTAQAASETGPDANGRYRLSLLPPATYTLDFGCGFGWEGSQALKDWWWNDESSQSSANPITLAPGQVFVANEQLPLPGVMKGLVTDSHTGAPLSDICVDVTYQNGANVDSIVTTSSGTWDLESLPLNVPLVVEFNGGACGTNPLYVSQWWEQKHNLSQADPITLSNSVPIASGVDAGLNPS